jgi:hypothetical protein
MQNWLDISPNMDMPPCPHTPGLWKHISHNINFCLVVNDFGVKYVNEDDAKHLINGLRELYEVTADCTGFLYLGLALDWNYEARTVDVSMPGYITKSLQHFNHPPSKCPRHSSHA